MKKMPLLWLLVLLAVLMTQLISYAYDDEEGEYLENIAAIRMILNQQVKLGDASGFKIK